MSSGVRDQESCQELLVIKNDVGPGTMGHGPIIVDSSIYISRDDQLGKWN